VVARLLEKDPARRYGDAGELILALEAVLAEDEPPSEAVSALPQVADIGGREARQAERRLPLVGREAELSMLSAALGRCLLGNGQTVVVAGEAGLGKTRLIQEIQTLAVERGALSLRGACVYSDAPNPYAPVVEMMRGYLQNGQAESTARLASEERAQLDGLLRGICGVLHVDHPYGRSEPTTWLRDSAPQDARAQVFEALLQFFALAAKIHPLVLAFDDLQWASPTTIQLFHYLARNVAETPILLLGSYRPEDVLAGDDGRAHPWRETLARLGQERLAQMIDLEPLDHLGAVHLAEQYLDMALEPDLGERLWREAEGNPLFIIEILNLLLDQGELPRAVQDEAFDLGQLAIPRTVRDTIMRRVDRLSAEDRDLLDWASVSGPRIDVGLMSAAVGKSRLVVMKQLLAIQRNHGLLRTEGQAFLFAHTKVQQVLYEQLPAPLCAEYHLSLADAIESRSGGTTDDLFYDLAATFFTRNSGKGYLYLCRAAEKAERAYALAELRATWSRLWLLRQRLGRLGGSRQTWSSAMASAADAGPARRSGGRSAGGSGPQRGTGR
jgi:predicted ATPase